MVDTKQQNAFMLTIIVLMFMMLPYILSTVYFNYGMQYTLILMIPLSAMIYYMIKMGLINYIS